MMAAAAHLGHHRRECEELKQQLAAAQPETRKTDDEGAGSAASQRGKD